MSKKAVVSWNAEQIKSIKRDLLMFDSFYYDPYLLQLQTKLLENVANLLKHNSEIIDEIYTTVDYLSGNGLLEKFELNEFKKGNLNVDLDKETIPNIMNEVVAYDSVHKLFLQKYNQTVEVLRKDYQSGFLKYINLLTDFSKFADHHVRLTSAIIESSKSNFSVSPIIENYDGFELGKETQVLKLIIKNLPVPDEVTPLDEVLDFKNDSDNRRRYFGLINWVNKISKSNLAINEIEDELNFFTLEFENRLKLERSKYRLTNLEVVVSLPIEIIENFIKLNWSKIPKSLFQFRKNKVNLMIGETKAPGRESTYIIYANEKFKKETPPHIA